MIKPDNVKSHKFLRLPKILPISLLGPDFPDENDSPPFRVELSDILTTNDGRYEKVAVSVVIDCGEADEDEADYNNPDASKKRKEAKENQLRDNAGEHCEMEDSEDDEEDQSTPQHVYHTYLCIKTDHGWMHVNNDEVVKVDHSDEMKYGQGETIAIYRLLEKNNYYPRIRWYKPSYEEPYISL